MKNIIFILLVSFTCSALAQNTPIGITEERLTDLDTRLSEIEFEKLLSPVRFNLMFNTTGYDHRVTGTRDRDHGDQTFANQFRLNISSEITKNIDFYGAIQNYSLWNDRLSGTPSANLNNIDDQANKGSQLDVMKAYVDFKCPNTPFIFSAGRLPTTDGPPQHLRSGLSRQGTYPMIGYSIPFDGMAFTWNAHETLKMSSDQKLISRSVYHPGSLGSKPNSIWSAQNRANYGSYVKNDKNGFTQMLEYEKGETKIWKKGLFIVQGTKFDLYASPSVVTTGLLKSQYGDDNDMYLVKSDNDKLSKIEIVTGYFELEDVFNTPFDIYANYTMDKINTKGKVEAYMYNNSFTGGPDLASIGLPGTAVPNGTRMFSKGIFTDDRSRGHRTLVGTKYDFTNKSLVGFEYMESSDRAMPTTFWGDFVSRYYTVNGEMYHVYTGKLFYNDKVNLKAGYINNHEVKSFSSLSFEDSGARIQTYYLGFGIRI